MNPTERRIKLGYPAKGPNGERYCRWCKGEIPKKSGRLTWCSEKCVTEYKLRNDPGVIRHNVFNRDKGICAKCGVDTEQKRKELQRLSDEWTERNPLWQYHAQLHPGMDRTSAWKLWEAERLKLLHPWPDLSRSWWDADHIVEVVNGGAEMGLTNLQTLCVLCHRIKTAQLATDRAKQRKDAKRASITPPKSPPSLPRE